MQGAEAEAEERRKSQSRRNIARASVAATLLLTCAAAFSGLQWRTAVKAEQTAVKAEVEARRAEGIATAAQEKTAQAQEQTAKALDETKTALTQTDKARKEADDAREKTVKAQEKTAEELIRYSWMDLANRQQEAARLNEVAKKLKVKPDVLLPSILCADENCAVTKKQQPGDFDCKTYLDSGFRYLYCSIRNIVSFDKVQAISGLNIFRPGGPHDNREVNFDDPVRFGHYNPQFLDWVEQRIIPDRTDPWFKGVTQLVYDTRIGPTARALYDTHQVLFADPQHYAAFLKRYESIGKDWREKLRLRKVNEERFAGNPVPFETVKARYQKGIEDKNKDVSFDLQEDFRWLADYFGTEGSTDWYLAYSAGGFWVRRSIDGTEAQIFRMVTKLLQTFEPAAITKP
jgi:hypothetical protein